jgi:shikimate kinase
VAPLVFIGFMGCGKSRVGHRVAEILGRDFVDLDAVIERHAGRSIPEIFAEQGEPVFRALETEVLAARLSEAPDGVLATGGGAWMEARNRARCRDAGAVSVYLDVPWEILLERIERQPERRPLYAGADATRRLYEHRVPTDRLADLIIATSGREPVDTVAHRVVRALSEAA